MFNFDQTRLADPRHSRAMRFGIGDIYEMVDGRRTAVVIQTHSDGRAGLMRYTDTSVEEWLLWAELHQEGKWCKRTLPSAGAG
jgi:hypothetical protein